MQRNIFSRPAPYRCTTIIEVATGKRAAHRLRQRADFENEYALHVWRDLGTWYAVIEHGTAELVCGADIN
jgi:hypothetical protein